MAAILKVYDDACVHVHVHVQVYDVHESNELDYMACALEKVKTLSARCRCSYLRESVRAYACYLKGVDVASTSMMTHVCVCAR